MFRLTARRTLIVLVIVCQLLCLGGMLYLTLAWVRQGAIAVVCTVAAFATSALSITAILLFNRQMGQTLQNLEEAVWQRSRDLLQTHDAVIIGLAKLAEFRDALTGQHLERIGQYCEILARALRDGEPQRFTILTEEWIHDLTVGCALHDIGKVGIPDSILQKAGELTPEERAMIEDHPIIGGECLQAMESKLGESNFLAIAREIAYSHHEWWDGTGYPFRLEGEQIPLSARIVALADVYDALTTARPYKPALPHDQAREIILSGMGTQFDPYIVGAFLLREADFAKVAKERNHPELERREEPFGEGTLDLCTLAQLDR